MQKQASVKGKEARTRQQVSAKGNGNNKGKKSPKTKAELSEKTSTR